LRRLEGRSCSCACASSRVSMSLCTAPSCALACCRRSPSLVALPAQRARAAAELSSGTPARAWPPLGAGSQQPPAGQRSSNAAYLRHAPAGCPAAPSPRRRCRCGRPAPWSSSTPRPQTGRCRRSGGRRCCRRQADGQRTQVAGHGCRSRARRPSLRGLQQAAPLAGLVWPGRVREGALPAHDTLAGDARDELVYCGVGLGAHQDPAPSSRRQGSAATRHPLAEQTNKRASEQTSERTNERASQRASRPASKQAS
jgi:hypothetical protein